MNPLRLFAAVTLTSIACVGNSISHAVESFVVENGVPRAEIVISDQPTRMQRVAAYEFQTDVQKISGARLPIVTEPSGRAVKIFIGQSKHTDALKVTASGLQDGAYRAVTGPDWMVLIGDDTDFTPRTPFAKGNADIPRAQAEWEKITNSQWGMPDAGLYKHRLKLPADLGKPDGVPTDKNETFEIWGLDERGSFNAVCAFMQKLGARWYSPGEVGEVWPALKTIALPKLDETVRPDFALRQFNFRFATAKRDVAWWAMRLGTRNDERLQIAHGMASMTGRDSIFAAHPEWFALYGGRRDYKSSYSKNQLCYSDEGLFRETVRWARAQLDLYKYKSVSIMPPDGYTSICQCEKCKGKDSPERHERGLLSDYVWDFVNRVAKEIAKTHPDAKVLNCAYGAYTLPPLKIEKLEPNVLVCIVGGRRPINKWAGNAKVEGEAAPEALRAAWVKKTGNPLLIFENYPFTDRGWYLPSFSPHALGETVNATKGISQGEDIWLSVGLDFEKGGIGFNHFLVYFTARMYWGGKNADVDAMFREYCQLFYGPAGQEMLTFFTYCEQNWSAMEDDKSKADAALDLFAKARAKAEAGSVYGQRLALVDEFLKGLRMKSEQLGQKRGPVPVLRLVGEAKGLVIDGKLDDEYWQNCPGAATGRLRELQTGRQPIFGTSVKAGWQGNSVCFAIRCDERPGEKPRNAATRQGDQGIWHGDCVEIELATETRSYYQIAISPNGEIVDLDRSAPRAQWYGWDAKAEVATHIADDHWTVEIRIPVTDDENDPLHQVIGRKPTQSLPWHINICRQRVREDGTEVSALSPTGTENFHAPMKFAYFYGGRSHQFDADPTVTDFLIASRAAEKVRPAAEALPLWLKLAEGEATPLQKAIALREAALRAGTLKDFAQADALAARIPIDAVKKTTQMETLLAQSQAPKVIANFGQEDIGKWPFWQRGSGYYLRGRAHAIAKAAKDAESDLENAREWTSDPLTRDGILLALANNREENLNDDAGALEAYRALVADRRNFGGADGLAALQGMARVLTKQGKFDEAVAALNRANPQALKGVWRGNILLSIGDVQVAAGRKTEARATFQTVLDDPESEPRHRQVAGKKIGSL